MVEAGGGSTSTYRLDAVIRFLVLCEEEGIFAARSRTPFDRKCQNETEASPPGLWPLGRL